MSSCGVTIGGLFRALHDGVPLHSDLMFMDMALAVHSVHQELLRDFCRALVLWVPKQSGLSGPPDGTCVVGYTDAVPEWRSVLMGKPLRAVHGGANGTGEIFRTPDGFAVVLEQFGAIMTSGAGEIVCLVDDRTDGRNSDGICNFNTAALMVTAGCLMRRGRILVHAGGVARNGRCHLWTGPSGSGKSTRVLELVESGWDFCGDDLIILGKDGDGVWKVWPYPRMVRASVETCAHFPALSELAQCRPGGEKHEFDISSFFPARVPGETVLERICCLDSENGARERRLTSAEAIARLGNCFMYMLWPGDGQKVLDSLCQIAEAVPAYVVPRSNWTHP